jgi:hypothetical protein
MLGLSRLFADDTSIGHTALDESTLQNMINIDLRAASNCSFSSLSELTWPQLSHTSDEYSKIGLMKVK